MADETQQPPAQPPAPSEEHPYWVKNPQTGEVRRIWQPADIQAAQANGYVNATQDEANKAWRDIQAEGWKGTVAAAGAGVASALPFARNLIRGIAPQLGKDVDLSAEKHPWVAGATELATFAGAALLTGGASAEASAAEAAGTAGIEAASKVVGEKVAQTAAEAAVEKGVAKAVPSLAERVLGRVPEMAANAQLSAASGAIQLTNEKDLPQDPATLASHVMSTLFWSTAGGVVGGEAAHVLIKGASAVASAAAKPIGKLGDVLANVAESYKSGNGEAVVAKSRQAMQAGLDAVDAMGKEKVIDRGMEAVRKKVGDAGMADLDAMRIQAEEAYQAARGDVLGFLGGKGSQKGKISADRIARALKAGERTDLLEALQRFHDAGKGLAAFHEKMAQAGATGLEDFAGKSAEQMKGLLEVQDAIKQGLVNAETHGAANEVYQGIMGGGVLHHFGHLLLGKAYVAGKAAKIGWKLAPAEFKAAQLARLAQLAEHVDGHLERVATATQGGSTGKLASPAASILSFEELKKLRDEVNQKVSNPQLAMDHLNERAGALNEVAPDTFGQMGLQYAQQLQTLQGILQWPEMPGPYAPQYMPSATELAKMSHHVAIVKDPRVFEANLAHGTATPTQAAIYRSAHGPRAEALGTKFAQGLQKGVKGDRATLKAMTGLSVLGLGPARGVYSQPTLAGVQGMYALKASQKGGPGSRGGTGGAGKISASQMITLPGQRISQRPVK